PPTPPPNPTRGGPPATGARPPLAGGWYGEAFVQYHSREGNGFVTRGPLAFDDEDSRIGYFGALANEQEFGPIFLRALTVTMFPDTLADNGVAAAERSDYVNATAKLAAGWDLDEQGRRLIVAGEVGHAFDTPERTVLGLPGSGDAGGWAWQLGADIEEFLPKQTIGIVYGQVDGGWLISNDYRQNNELAELRWQYQFTKEFRIQFRARWRRDLERRAGAAFLQRDRDMRIRATWKF
ncbi:MAG: hypothetical protein R3323_09815, partial [Wenzhouxiangellaceae bacterium]|nr:hypothetical protein [Wenzhouxiangellaceae bacterium]